MTAFTKRFALAAIGVFTLAWAWHVTAEPDAAHATSALPDGWVGTAQRDELRPAFSYEPHGGQDGAGALIIKTQDSFAQHGRLQRTFPVAGGKHYRFSVRRQTANVSTPRRSTPVRIVWQDADGKPVQADPPPGRANEPGALPLAEPEHPLDGPTDEAGVTTITHIYRAPSKAAQAVVELHLQWAPGGMVTWSNVAFAETDPPPSRKVRLATVHHIPSGKSPRANCEEYAPFIAQAAEKKADLVVLGETVPYVRVNKKPHEVAEPVPGPSSEYFGALAKQHHLHIVACLYERDREAVYNTAILIGPDGLLIGKYRKVCLPHSEVENGVTPGDDYPVFETKLGKIGMMICYDGFFPEVARELTNRGAEVIAWPVWGCNPLLGAARACENHVYVVSSTYTDVKSNWMISAVFDHAGAPIAKAAAWGDVVVAEVDLAQPHFWRNNLGDFHAMAQRHRPPAPPQPASPSVPYVAPEPAQAKPVTRRSLPPAPAVKEPAVKTVAVLLFEGVELLDFAGPAEVFIIANRGKSFRVVTVAASKEPLKTMGGVTVVPDFAFDDAPRAHIVVVPGGKLGALGPAGREWIKTASRDAEITMSVCYGAFLLADAGLLDGVTATTHHWGLDDLQSAAPKCKVVRGERFIDSGRIITTAGVTAGIDGALHIIERTLGPEAATWAADEWMEHRRAIPAGTDPARPR